MYYLYVHKYTCACAYICYMCFYVCIREGDSVCVGESACEREKEREKQGQKGNRKIEISRLYTVERGFIQK